jgi:hypothetical protein
MMTVLSRQEPVLDDFLVEVKRLMPLLEQQYPQRDAQSQEESNVRTLGFIMKMLEEKAAGRPYWKEIYSCPEQKHRRRTQPPMQDVKSYDRLPSTSIQKLVQTFDEEMEMDFLQKRTQFDFDTVQSSWDENRMVTGLLVQPEEAEYPANVPEGKAAVA